MRCRLRVRTERDDRDVGHRVVPHVDEGVESRTGRTLGAVEESHEVVQVSERVAREELIG